MWRTAGSDLLNALLLGVPPDQGVENGEDVPAIFDHAVEDVAEFRVALGVSVPFDHNGLRHFDVAAQLVGRMAAQEQTIEKRRFPLGKREVCSDFGGYDDLSNRGHEKSAVYRNASPRQVVQTARCGLAGKVSTRTTLRSQPLRNRRIGIAPPASNPEERFPKLGSGELGGVTPKQRGGCHLSLTRHRMMVGGSRFQIWLNKVWQVEDSGGSFGWA